MGQVGLHGLTGLLAGPHLARSVQDRAGRRALMFGFVLGNLAPDLDFLAVVAMYPLNPGLAVTLHRGFSHSLLAAFALALGFRVAAYLMGDRALRYLGTGLALGVAAHFVEDVFLWFSPVDIFWPASVFGLIPPVNIWSWWHAPPVLVRLMAAAEFAAFALYYDRLCRLAASLQTDQEMVPHVQRMATVCWTLWAILTALAVELPDPVFTSYSSVPMGIVFMPACFYITWQMQSTIELSALLHPSGRLKL